MFLPGGCVVVLILTTDVAVKFRLGSQIRAEPGGPAYSPVGGARCLNRGPELPKNFLDCILMKLGRGWGTGGGGGGRREEGVPTPFRGVGLPPSLEGLSLCGTTMLPHVQAVICSPGKTQRREGNVSGGRHGPISTGSPGVEAGGGGPWGSARWNRSRLPQPGTRLLPLAPCVFGAGLRCV